MSHPNQAQPVIALRDVTKTYPSPAGAFTALANINLTIDRGEFVAVVGRERQVHPVEPPGRD